MIAAVRTLQGPDMINQKATLYLIAFPVGLMGIVQLLFALLSGLVFHDGEVADFLNPAIAMLVGAGFCLMLGRSFNVDRIGYRDSLLFAVLTWVILSVLGAIPIITITGVSFTDGVFESISALTTTGATILSGLDGMPAAFLMYRQFLQWMGGVGVVLFVVAILPMLNIGGMKLMKAETAGPIKDDKLSPRVANAAHSLWGVYVLLTVLCAVAYWLCGMSAYDAIAHSFTTVSTGGFSTHDASMGFFTNPWILVVCDVFMLLGAISFSLHFRAWIGRSLSQYWHDEETRGFILVAIVLSLVISGLLFFHGTYNSPLEALNLGFFHLISFMTSTGFGAGSYTSWPVMEVFLLVFSAYIGGCAGSTAGGNKMIRNLITFRLIGIEIKRLIHPRGEFLVKHQGKSLEPDILHATMAFMFIAALTTLVVTLLLMMTSDLDLWSAMSAVSACINVSGPAFGALGSNFQPVSDTGIWILSAAMILGRLEYFTVLTLFAPVFWRH
jgi:trk system potassium uptake protein